MDWEVSMVSEELLKIICCPACRSRLRLSEDGLWLICDKCNVKYPIKDGIPVLIVEEAKKLEKE